MILHFILNKYHTQVVLTPQREHYGTIDSLGLVKLKQPVNVKAKTKLPGKKSGSTVLIPAEGTRDTEIGMPFTACCRKRAILELISIFLSRPERSRPKDLFFVAP